MRLLRLKTVTGSLRRRHWALIRLTLGLFALVLPHSLPADQPTLSLPARGTDPYHVQLTLSNCTDTNVQYVIQMSTNLTTWTPVTTNQAAANFTVTVPSANPFCFYRTMAIPAPILHFGIICKSNFNANGIGMTVDSFDSGNPIYSTWGQWDVTKRKAGGNIGANYGLVGDTSLGNVNIWGRLCTGPGSASDVAQIGPYGEIGDLAWNNSGDSGIEGYGTPFSWWQTNFNVATPDVPAPNTTGWATYLPPSSNGIITLNGGTNNRTITLVGANYVTNYTWTNYVISTPPSAPLYIAGPTILWVQGSFAQGLTIASTNHAKLVLYIGRTTGTGDALILSGNQQVNANGLAANLQYYGLPSLTAISQGGNAGFIGTIYAPEANFSGGGGGNGFKDSSGAMVVNSITLNGHWNFHYDESLSTLH